MEVRSLSRGLNEGDFVDLFEGGEAATDAVERRFTEEAHAFALSLFADLRGGSLFEDQLTDGVGEVEQFVDGGSPTIAGAATLDAASALEELEVAPFVGIESALDKLLFRVFDGDGAVGADGADESLGEDAVQSGDEVVGFDAHVEKAAEDIDDVVGVNGGEDEMAGERGVDGDLRGFGVTDFADENLVGIVAEDGAQSASEGEAFFFVDGNLGDAADLIFDGVFDGDDFFFVAFDLVERGVEGCGFSGASGAGDQDHAVRLANVAAKAAQVFLGKADDFECEVAELFAHRLFVKYAKNGVFAMHGRHDGDAEVNEAAFVADAETPILRDAALSNVQLAHDLDAGEDGGVMFAGNGRHGGLKDAVNAVLDEQGIVIGFDMDVRGAALERGKDGGVDEADDGAKVFIGGKLLDRDAFVRVFLAGDDVEGESFAGFIENALGLFRFLEQVGDLRERGDARLDAAAEEAGNLVEDHEFRWVADGDDENVVALFEWDEVIAKHQLDGNGAQEVVLDFEVLEVGKLGAVAARELLGLGAFIDHAKLSVVSVLNLCDDCVGHGCPR
uniref:Uncharacterized protein n=1 Tax=mine drainage metagenome TaxID=410659 RepID=E6QI37_9ZZZZ